MKGGITSGVVYPATVSRFAETYQFVNIGGTSAGAIAAAATAAAEYRRAQGSGEGFKKLSELPRKVKILEVIEKTSNLNLRNSGATTPFTQKVTFVLIEY